jgi:hypothetical protein
MQETIPFDSTTESPFRQLAGGRTAWRLTRNLQSPPDPEGKCDRRELFVWLNEETRAALAALEAVRGEIGRRHGF